MSESFNFEEILKEIGYHLRELSTPDFVDTAAKNPVDTLREALEVEQANMQKFRAQIHQLISQGQHDHLLDRLQKASGYYDRIIREQMLLLLTHLETAKRFSRTKTYTDHLQEIDLLLTRKREALDRSGYIARCILEGRPIERSEAQSARLVTDRQALLREATEIAARTDTSAFTTSGKLKKKSASGKAAKGSTYEETFTLLRSGLSLTEIATRRGLSRSTIEGHVSRGVQTGVIDIRKVMTDETIAEIMHLMDESDPGSLKELYARSKAKFSFHELRMVQAMMQKEDQ